MKEEIYVWADGRWIWTCESVPEHIKEAPVRVRVGPGWSDREVCEFVDNYLLPFMDEE